MATKQGSDISTTHSLMDDFADFDDRAAHLRQQLRQATKAESKTSHATKAITPASRGRSGLEEEKEEEVYPATSTTTSDGFRSWALITEHCLGVSFAAHQYQVGRKKGPRSKCRCFALSFVDATGSPWSKH
jgi:hypothetical protein